MVVPASLRPSPRMSPGQFRHVSNVLGSLFDADLLKVWDFEESLSTRIGFRSSDFFITRNAITLPMETYEKIYSKISEGTSEYRRNLMRRKAPLVRFEGVSELVTLQSGLWAVGLAEYFKTPGILLPGDRLNILRSHVTKAMMVEDIKGPVLEQFLRFSDIGPLAYLTAEDIIAARARFPQVREYMTSLVGEALDASGDAGLNLAVSSAQQRMVDDFVREAKEQAARGRDLVGESKKTAIDVTINFAGILFPPLVLLSFAKNIFQMATALKRPKGLYYLVGELNRRTSRQNRRN